MFVFGRSVYGGLRCLASDPRSNSGPVTFKARSPQVAAYLFRQSEAQSLLRGAGELMTIAPNARLQNCRLLPAIGSVHSAAGPVVGAMAGAKIGRIHLRCA